MKEYHKIQTVFLRDPAMKFKTLLEGTWGTQEFGYLAANEWEFTEKVDGTNIRIIREGNCDTLKGKTEDSDLPAILVAKLQSLILQFPIGAIDGDFILYGEGYGAKIQKGGGNYSPDPEFVLFDVKIGDIWLRRADVEDIGHKLRLKVVPIIGTGTLWHMVEIVKEGFKSQWGDFLAEGIVARPIVDLFTRTGERVITKLKYKDFVR